MYAFSLYTHAYSQLIFDKGAIQLGVDSSTGSGQLSTNGSEQ